MNGQQSDKLPGFVEDDMRKSLEEAEFSGSIDHNNCIVQKVDLISAVHSI